MGGKERGPGGIVCFFVFVFFFFERCGDSESSFYSRILPNFESSAAVRYTLSYLCVCFFFVFFCFFFSIILTTTGTTSCEKTHHCGKDCSKHRSDFFLTVFLFFERNFLFICACFHTCCTFPSPFRNIGVLEGTGSLHRRILHNKMKEK